MRLGDGDRDWLVNTLRGDTPVFEGCVRSDRVRRLTSYGLVERRWSPRDGWLLLLTPQGRQLARELAE